MQPTAKHLPYMQYMSVVLYVMWQRRGQWVYRIDKKRQHRSLATLTPFSVQCDTGQARPTDSSRLPPAALFFGRGDWRLPKSFFFLSCHYHLSLSLLTVTLQITASRLCNSRLQCRTYWVVRILSYRRLCSMPCSLSAIRKAWTVFDKLILYSFAMRATYNILSLVLILGCLTAFTAQRSNVSALLGVVIMFVRLSLLCNKQKNILPIFYTVWKVNHSTFLASTALCRWCPPTWNLRSNWPTLFEKRQISAWW